MSSYRSPGFSVITDFPDASGESQRVCFDDPVELLVADRIEDVAAVLARVEQCTAEGRFAVGYMSYDAAPAFDSALRITSRAATPFAWFAIFASERRIGRPERIPSLAPAAWQPDVEKDAYEEAIEDILCGIIAGDFYQVNYTLRMQATFAGVDAHPASLYEALRAAQPSSYGMYLNTGRFHILSISPELFFARTGRRIETRPMKGTAARGRWPAEDTAVAAALASSEKDRAENVMIVDLIRNDLGRIAETGTVSTPHLFDVERHPTLWQMTSTVTAELRDDVRLYDIFAALFPCGSVVGAPKIAAAKWIADHEASTRGVYCGAMGIVRPGGDCVFNVAIRTLVVDTQSGIATYGTGGGVTIDSTAASEYDELLAKSAVLRGAPADFALIETMRLSDGRYVRRDKHVRRVLASARYFDFANTSDSMHDASGVSLEASLRVSLEMAIESALDAQARATPTGDHRVRLLVERDGSVSTTSAPVEPLGLEVRLPASPTLGSTSTPTLMQISTIGGAIRCALSTSPVSSRDRMLFHKTTLRAVYEDRRAEHADVDEVILINERGELTECSIGNLVVDIDGTHCTPPLDCGLLPGIFRQELLEQGAIVERVLLPSDLPRAAALWRINSLREWTKLDHCG